MLSSDAGFVLALLIGKSIYLNGMFYLHAVELIAVKNTRADLSRS